MFNDSYSSHKPSLSRLAGTIEPGGQQNPLPSSQVLDTDPGSQLGSDISFQHSQVWSLRRDGGSVKTLRYLILLTCHTIRLSQSLREHQSQGDNRDLHHRAWIQILAHRVSSNSGIQFSLIVIYILVLRVVSVVSTYLSQKCLVLMYPTGCLTLHCPPYCSHFLSLHSIQQLHLSSLGI